MNYKVQGYKSATEDFKAVFLTKEEAVEFLNANKENIGFAHATIVETDDPAPENPIRVKAEWKELVEENIKERSAEILQLQTKAKEAADAQKFDEMEQHDQDAEELQTDRATLIEILSSL